MGEGPFQLFQLRRRPMHFEPDQVDHSQQLREQSANVVEMRQNAFGIGVTFTTKHFIAVDGKLIEKILFLGLSLLDELRETTFDRLQFSGMHFEIGMKADEV